MSVSVSHVCSTFRGLKTCQVPWTRVAGVYEPPCVNLGPLQEQSVLLTDEPSLQPLPYFLRWGLSLNLELTT